MINNSSDCNAIEAIIIPINNLPASIKIQRYFILYTTFQAKICPKCFEKETYLSQPSLCYVRPLSIGEYGKELR